MSELNLKPQKSRLIIAVAILLLASMTFLASQYYFSQSAPVDSSDKTLIDVRIADNSNARQVASALKKNNLIHSEGVFLGYCRRTGLDNQLKSGHYQFSRSQSLEEIARAIAAGKVVNLAFTIPEGYTIEQIGELLVKRQICTREQWQKALQKDYNFDFLKAVPTKNNRLEGFLFPETYLISEDMTAEQIITMMLNEFNLVWKKEFALKAKEKNLDINETIILAAMIEKEAKLDSERQTISGVMQNRLREKMPLQICATVIYSLGGHKDTVTYQDLQVDSPYNTYKYLGLPPGPIASPGRASIEAAINPEKHGYYYYLSKGDGSHYFSRTYNEHLQAKRIYIE